MIKASTWTRHHIYEITINISNINTFKGDLDTLSTSIIKSDEDDPHSKLFNPTKCLLDLVQGLVIKLS